MTYLVVLLLLAGCAGPMKSMTLYPRSPATTPGHGTVDLAAKQLDVAIGANTYRGALVFESTRGNNKATSLLLGAAGQLRCDLSFGPLFSEATGVCVDAESRTFDVLVK